MSDVTTTTESRPPRFLDLIPDAERHQASGTFYRAVRRVSDPARAVQLAVAWAQVDLITQPESNDRLRRLLDAIEAEPELALGYAIDVAEQLR